MVFLFYFLTSFNFIILSPPPPSLHLDFHYPPSVYSVLRTFSPYPTSHTHRHTLFRCTFLLGSFYFMYFHTVVFFRLFFRACKFSYKFTPPWFKFSTELYILLSYGFRWTTTLQLQHLYGRSNPIILKIKLPLLLPKKPF